MTETEATTDWSISDLAMRHWIIEFLMKTDGPEKIEFHIEDGYLYQIHCLESGQVYGYPLVKGKHYVTRIKHEVCNTSAECLDFEYGED